MAINDEKTLGFTLELYTNYMDGVKVSLLKIIAVQFTQLEYHCATILCKLLKV